MTITYASEVMPVALRQYLTTYVNFCWGLGQVIGVGVVKSQLGRTDDFAWQLPYYLQLMWPPILGGFILFAPESPWWLVRRGKYEEAKKSLYRLTDTKRETDFDADQSIAMMKHTIEMEAQVSEVCCLVLKVELTRALADHGRCELSRLFPGIQLATNRNHMHGLGHPELVW